MRCGVGPCSCVGDVVVSECCWRRSCCGGNVWDPSLLRRPLGPFLTRLCTYGRYVLDGILHPAPEWRGTAYKLLVAPLMDRTDIPSFLLQRSPSRQGRDTACDQSTHHVFGAPLLHVSPGHTRGMCGAAPWTRSAADDDDPRPARPRLERALREGRRLSDGQLLHSGST